MFTTIAELESYAHWRFYKTKRCIAYTLGKQIFEKYFLCCIKQGRLCHWSSVRSSRLQLFFKKRFLKISPISQKCTCAGVSFHCEIGEIFKNTHFYRTPPVAASDLSFFKYLSFKNPIVQFQLCLLLLATLRILFEETITETISSVIVRSTNKAFWILFTITAV